MRLNASPYFLLPSISYLPYEQGRRSVDYHLYTLWVTDRAVSPLFLPPTIPQGVLVGVMSGDLEGVATF